MGAQKLFEYVSPPIPFIILQEIQDRKVARQVQCQLNLHSSTQSVRTSERILEAVSLTCPQATQDGAIACSDIPQKLVQKGPVTSNGAQRSMSKAQPSHACLRTSRSPSIEAVAAPMPADGTSCLTVWLFLKVRPPKRTLLCVLSLISFLGRRATIEHSPHCGSRLSNLGPLPI